MDKLVIIIIVLVILFGAVVAIQIGVKKGVDVWPINQISDAFNNNADSNGDSGISGIGSGGSGGGGGGGGGGSGGGGSSGSGSYDINGDGIFSCDFTEQGNYVMEGNHIIITYQGKTSDFNFHKEEVSGKLHPDNLPSITLKYNLYPDNPDDVLYSGIFLTADNKLYVCI
jgi:hypothetical protein